MSTPTSNKKLFNIFQYLITFTQFHTLEMFQDAFQCNQSDALHLIDKLQNSQFNFITFWTSLDNLNQLNLVTYLNNKF